MMDKTGIVLYSEQITRPDALSFLMLKTKKKIQQHTDSSSGGANFLILHLRVYYTHPPSVTRNRVMNIIKKQFYARSRRVIDVAASHSSLWEVENAELEDWLEKVVSPWCVWYSHVPSRESVRDGKKQKYRWSQSGLCWVIQSSPVKNEVSGESWLKRALCWLKRDLCLVAAKLGLVARLIFIVFMKKPNIHFCPSRGQLLLHL